MNDTFLTLEHTSEGIYKEKGSKFLAFAIPVNSLDEIKAHLENYRKKYYDARHVCYAYRLGADGAEYRANDDGEPSGTAGKPIHGQMLSNNITNVLIVVVRYFGGVKLGTGGLSIAYRDASADAIANNTIVEKIVKTPFSFTFSYENMDAVLKIVRSVDAEITDRIFECNCLINCLVPQANANEFKAKITDFVTFSE